MAEVIDYTEARRARGLPPTPRESAELLELAREYVWQERLHGIMGWEDDEEED